MVERARVPSDLTLRVKSLESLLVEKGLVDPAVLDALIDTMEHKVGPRNGARVVARAHAQREKRQHVYSVRFAATELWGDDASHRDSVHLDLWDDYLERA